MGLKKCADSQTGVNDPVKADLSLEEKRDLRVMSMIRSILREDKNTDVRISMGSDKQLRVTKQKNSNIKI